MLNLRRLIGIIILTLLCVIVANAQSQRQSKGIGGKSNPPQTQSPNKQQKAEPDKRGTEQSPLVVKTITPPKTDSETKQDTKDHDEKASQDWWIVRFTGILAGVAFLQLLAFVLQAVYLYRGFKATEKAADAAKKSADALPVMERAYIFVKEISLDPSPNLDNYDEIENPTKIAVGQHYYRVIIENYGKTPAIITRTEIFANVMIPNIPKITGIPSPKMPKIIRTVGSGKEKSFDLDFWIDSKEKLEGVFSFQLRLLCIGCIQYEDIFGDSHETGFCWWYEPITTHEFHYYDHPNNYHT